MADLSTAEYRSHATLLFADLCDYTTLTEAVDPEEVAPLLRRVREQVDSVVRRHQGTVNEWRGDGVLCIFGIPQASEEDPKLAIEAALEMHQAVQGLEQGLSVPPGFRVRLHTGIDSGVVFARQREGEDGFDVIGDAVNTAARLCARAAPGETWVSQPALEGFRERFLTGGMESLALKGKREPVEACRVLGRSAVATRFAASQRRGLTPLVGRAAPLQRLAASLNAALQAGELQLVSVVGTPGIGKTRTLEEFRQRAAEAASVYSGLCDSPPSAPPLQPFIDILRQVLQLPSGSSQAEALAALDSTLPQLDPQLSERRDVILHLLGLGQLQTPGLEPELVQRSFIEVLVQLFEGLSRNGPLLLMLDDWQWADDVSRQVLGNVLRVLRNTASLVVVASRDLSDPLLSAAGVIPLDPLTHEESAQVIAAILPYSLNLGLTQAIHERAGGNPLYLEELCRALPSEASSSEEDLAGSRVPSTLRGIIQVRMERLPEPVVHVLHASAVIGSELPFWLLSLVCDAPGLEEALRALVEGDLIQPVNAQAAFRFKHGSTREVVYECVRLPQRRRLHAKIAAVLERHAEEAEQLPPYEELSYHLAASGDHARAAHFAELAGDRASASSSLDHARQYYRSALDALQRLTQTPELERQWIAVFDKWAAASLYSPSQEHLALIRRAGELSLRLKDLASAARAEYWLSWFSYALGDLSLATKYCRSALARAEAAHDQRLAGQLLLSLGQTLAASAEYGEALAHLAAGLETKRRSYRSKPETLRQQRRAPLAFAYALACKGLVHGDLGQFEQAYDCFNEALDSLHGTGHAVEGSCLGLLGMVLLVQGRWREALETAARAQATAERVNGPYVFAMSRTVSGYARWMTTRDPEALAELLQAAKWLEGRGIGLFISFNYAYLADALASAGDTRQALDYAARALACASRSDRLGETLAHRTLARIARQEPQRLLEAQMHLDRALSSARARQSAREVALTNLEAGALHLARGEKDLAAQSLVAARRIFAQLGMEHYENEASSMLRGTRSLATQDSGVEGDR